jgi:hypothetical protein
MKSEAQGYQELRRLLKRKRNLHQRLQSKNASRLREAVKTGNHADRVVLWLDCGKHCNIASMCQRMLNETEVLE